MFDEENHKGNLLVNENGTSTGLINDWDGGLDFWPFGSINYDKVYMPIDIFNLQKEFEKNKSSQKSVKFPEKQRQLENMIAGLDILNNPTIMIVTLKK